MKKKKINLVDKKILDIMQKNARTTNTEVAKQLKMVPSAILERIRKLEKRGIIKQYKTIVDTKEIDLDLLVYMLVKCNTQNFTDACGDALSAIENIEEVHEIMGEYSYLIKVRVKDMEELSQIVKEKINSIPEISQTNSISVIKTVKEHAPLPIRIPTKPKK